MKVYYYSNAVKEDSLKKIYKKGILPGLQAQVFNNRILDGLAKNDVELTADTVIPTSKELIDETFLTIPDEGYYHYHKIINIPGLKDIIIFISTYFNTRKRLNDDAICVGDALCCVSNLAASLAAKHKHKPYIAILTDIPELFENNNLYFKLVNGVLKNASHYVFLTPPMEKRINKDHKPYIIMEGACTPVELTEQPRKNVFMYTGGIDALNGVPKLVEAFLSLNSDHELHLYGEGDYQDELAELCNKHTNVRYFGVFPHEEIVKRMQGVKFLVTARTMKDPMVPYSFPSKLFDYLGSGTPCISTPLPCLSNEFRSHMNLFDGEEVEDIQKGLQRMLDSDYNTLLDKAKDAYGFVTKEKNNVAQAKRITELAGVKHD